MPHPGRERGSEAFFEAWRAAERAAVVAELAAGAAERIAVSAERAAVVAERLSEEALLALRVARDRISTGLAAALGAAGKAETCRGFPLTEDGRPGVSRHPR